MDTAIADHREKTHANNLGRFKSHVKTYMFNMFKVKILISSKVTSTFI